MDVCQIKYKFNIYVYKDNKIGNKKWFCVTFTYIAQIFLNIKVSGPVVFLAQRLNSHYMELFRKVTLSTDFFFFYSFEIYLEKKALWC